jgi:hypothetical protein
MGIVYIIKFDDTSDRSFYKIGITQNDVCGRISNIQTSLPFKIKTIKTVKSSNHKELEKSLHAKYSEYRVLNEWFSFGVDELLFLSDISEL